MVAGIAIIHANDTIEMKEGSSITSTVPHTCTEDKTTADLYTCISPYAQKADKIEYTDIMARLREQFPSYLEDKTGLKFENWWGALKSNYTIYLISSGETKLSGAHITGSRIGICAASAEVKNSQIDASGRGCPSDSGLAKGLQYAKCAGTGGSNGGSGGYGGLKIDVSGQEEAVCP